MAAWTAFFEPSPDAFAAWTAWFEQLGPNLEDRGSGYTLINTDDLEKVVKLARSHPLMRFGGVVEIGELTLMNAGKELADAEDR